MRYQHQYTDGTPIHFPLGKVVCVGRNYAEHAKELNNEVPTEPLLFIKPGSCVVPMLEHISIPKDRGAVHYEAEIAVLIGKPLAPNPSEAEVIDAISGLAPALDLTLRDLQDSLKKQGYPWERAKAFDGACVLAPFVNADMADFTNLAIRLWQNNELRQDGNSSQMLNPIVPLLQHIAGEFKLLPGDVILTGTPKGVGALAVGDVLCVQLEQGALFTCDVI